MNPENDTNESQSKSTIDTSASVNTKGINSAGQESKTDEEKPKVFAVIAILLFLIGLLHGLGALMTTGVIVSMNQALGTAGGVHDNILELFPVFAIFPVLYSVLSIYFIYLTFKVREGSKRSFWTVLVSLIVSQAIVAVASYLFIDSFQTLMLSLGAEMSNNLAGGFSLINPGLIINVLTIVVLLFSLNKFTFPTKKISKIGKVLLVVLIILFVLPINAFVAYGLTRQTDKDFGYSEVENLSSFHVYKPGYLPGNLVHTTKYQISDSDLAGYGEVVKTTFGPSLANGFEQEISTIVVMNQVSVDDEFNIDSYIQEKVDEGFTLTGADVKIASGEKAFVLERSTESLNLIYLIFVTPEDVLVELGTPNASRETLVMISNSLK